MHVTLITHTPDPQRLIETCARISYASQNDPFDPKVNSEFIRKLIKNGHESPLEHASATFLIEDISRACSHQIVRHRLASFSQRSDRYTKYRTDTTNPNFVPKQVLPQKLHMVDDAINSEAGKILRRASSECAVAYGRLIELGIPAEDARLILPQGFCTSLYMTANFREWRHFLQLRLDRHAQWEIREVAREILRKLCVDGMYDCFADIQAKFDCEAVSTVKECSGQPDNDKVVDMLKGRRFTEDQLMDIERTVFTARDALRRDLETGDHSMSSKDVDIQAKFDCEVSGK